MILFHLENSQNSLYQTMIKIAKIKEKSEKEKEAIQIFEKIHLYSIQFEEFIFRKDYLMQYLRLTIEQNLFLKTIEVLTREIEFLKQ